MKTEQIRAAVMLNPDVYPYLSGRVRFSLYDYDETKTEATYFRQLWSRVLALYRSEIHMGEFLTELSNIVQNQITRAWRAALRDEGLDPNLASTPGGEFYDEMEAMVLSEFDYADNFAYDIARAGANQSGFEPFRMRTELWANRYNDAYNKATLEINTQLGGKLEWKLGETEEHCETCAALNELVAFAHEWQTAGFRPQNPPNPLLDCGGWQCDCKLVATDKRRNPKVLNTLMNIAVARGI